MDVIEYIKAVKKNYDDSPVYNTTKYLNPETNDDSPVDRDYGVGYRPRSIPDNFVPVMPQAPGLQDPATSVKELATGGVATPKRGLVDEPGSYGGRDSYVISDELKELIKEKIKLKPGQKWNFYNPKTGKGHSFGVPKGTPLYDKARYYGGKQAKDLARKKEELAKMSPKERAEYNRIKAEKTKKFLEKNPEKAEARKIQQQKYRAEPEIKKRDLVTRATYESKPERIKMKKEYMTKRQAERGIFPTGNNYKENVWRDVFRSSQVKNPRWVVSNDKRQILSFDQYPKKDGKTFWGEGKYKQVKFLDTETGQLIKLDNSIKGKGITMEKYLNSNFGKGTYDNALNTYKSKNAMRNYELKIGGKNQKLGTVLKDRLFTPKEIAARGDMGTSVFHVSHDEGVGKNWWKSRVTTGDANFELKNLDRTLKRDLSVAKTELEKNKVLKAYERNVKKQPGGIISTIEQGTFGIKPTEKSVIEAASKKARITTAEGYRDLIKAIGCPGKAMGGRVGFQSGTTCLTKGVDAINSGKIAKGAQARNMGKLVNTVKLGGSGALKTLGALGIGFEAFVIGGEVAYRAGSGEPLDEAFLNAMYMSGKAERLKSERANLSQEEKLIPEAEELLYEIQQLEKNKENIIGANQYEFTGETDQEVRDRIDSQILNKQKRLDIIRGQDLVDPKDIRNISAAAKKMELESRRKAKSELHGSGMKKDVDKGIPTFGLDSYEEDSGTIAPVFSKKKTYKELEADYLSSMLGGMDISVNNLEGVKKLVKDLSKDPLIMEGEDTTDRDYFRSVLSELDRYKKEDEDFYEKNYGFNPAKFIGIKNPKPQYYKGVSNYAGGGIANLTRTTPPERGPQYRGFDYLRKHGRGY